MSGRHQLQKRKRAGAVPLDISISAACGAAHSTFIKRHIKLAHAIMRPALAELSIALVGDRRMSALHEQFMSIAGPTDVLTFPLDMDAAGNALSGEVVICVPQARRRARENGNSIPSELLLYALHGMLHLCGYDDRTRREFEIMHEIEDDLLCRLGVGPVFGMGSDRRASRDTDKSGRGADRRGRTGSVAKVN
jgi:probable rRNA maturation factor